MLNESAEDEQGLYYGVVTFAVLAILSFLTAVFSAFRFYNIKKFNRNSLIAGRFYIFLVIQTSLSTLAIAVVIILILSEIKSAERLGKDFTMEDCQKDLAESRWNRFNLMLLIIPDYMYLSSYFLLCTQFLLMFFRGHIKLAMTSNHQKDEKTIIKVSAILIVCWLGIQTIMALLFLFTAITIGVIVLEISI